MHAGMKWFRANIKHGARLALLALAVQFALSFGHFHGVAQAAPAIQSSLSQQPDASRSSSLAASDATIQSAQRQQPASNHDPDRQSNDGCAICAVIAMANTVLFATPPLLLVLPEAIEFLYRTTDTEFVHRNSARVAFQPRAPPIS
jgi:hypothetical protein